MPVQLSCELSLLMAACESDMAFVAAHDRLRDRIDWQRFGSLARAHKLGALAATRISRAGLAMVPEETMLMLDCYRRDIVTRNLAQEVGTVQVIQLLAAAGVRALAFKGVAAGRLLHGDVHNQRVSSDIDILVAAEDMASAEAALAAAGYRKDWPGFEVNSRAQPTLMYLAHAFTWVSPDMGLAVELHHRLTHNPYWFDVRFDRLWQAAEKVALQVGNIRTLGPADMAAYMCCHAVDHSYFVLKWIDDAAKAVTRAEQMIPDPDWLPSELGAVTAVDRTKELVGALYAGIEGETGLPIQERRLSAGVARAIARIEEADFGDDTRRLADLPREIAGTVRRAVLGGSLKAAWHDVFQVLADPRDARALGLGLAWQPLYAVLGLPFSAWRYLTRP
ncbi:nucleotidyltransferase family protein [Anderseniella sp. Alg231-50]|uniref:nucleotidyltransferase family protein n=1 Tax=Anderseniella sp. Alg231-50 TaxID=1922226 RepID=UPI000D5506C1